MHACIQKHVCCTGCSNTCNLVCGHGGLVISVLSFIAEGLRNKSRVRNIYLFVLVLLVSWTSYKLFAISCNACIDLYNNYNNYYNIYFCDIQPMYIYIYTEWLSHNNLMICLLNLLWFQKTSTTSMSSMYIYTRYSYMYVYMYIYTRNHISIFAQYKELNTKKYTVVIKFDSIYI